MPDAMRHIEGEEGTMRLFFGVECCLLTRYDDVRADANVRRPFDGKD